jgi:hypothetical protein
VKGKRKTETDRAGASKSSNEVGGMKVLLRMAPMACIASGLLFIAAGCKNYGSPDTTNANSTEAAPPGQIDPGDPANANLAPVSNSSDNTGVPSGAYAGSPQAASQLQTYSSSQDPYANQQSSSTDYDDYAEEETPSEYAPDPPPAMPDYQQPPCPGDGYIWTPGYWGYQNQQGYYWVPGAWVMAPYEDALWTPGWWGFINGRYGWHQGYWGRHIGYYGGIAYGNGYDGFGYQGGYWKDNHFEINQFDNNVNKGAVHYVYNYRVSRYNTSRVSFNGGQGGIQARPRPEEVEALHEQHNLPMTAQVQLAQQARSDRQNFSSVNRGRPQMLASNQPLQADRNVPTPQPVRYTPPQSKTENTPWQSGARPQPIPYHAVGPEPMIPRLQTPQEPAARGGPIRAPGTPQVQQRQPEQRPLARPQPQRPQPQRPPQERPRGPR